MCWAAGQDFDSDARSPAAARAFVRTQLTNLLDLLPDATPVPDLEIVVSELVTNAVRAGAGTVRVEVRVHRDELDLDVIDDGPGWPRLVQPGERDPRGRGLVLVDALADRWHAERLPSGGKRISVTIGIPHVSTVALVCDRPHRGSVERDG